MKSRPLAGWFSGLGAAVLLMTGAASAADVRVMISAGFYGVYSELGPVFERASGHHLVTTRGPSMGDSPEAIPTRLARGETADVVILDGGAADELARRGLVRADSKAELARSLVGMVVRAGAAKPDIGSVEAFRKALLAAKSIAYSDSGSGTYLSTTLFAKLGVADQVKDKSRKVRGPPSGEPVAAVVFFQVGNEVAYRPALARCRVRPRRGRGRHGGNRFRAPLRQRRRPRPRFSAHPRPRAGRTLVLRQEAQCITSCISGYSAGSSRRRFSASGFSSWRRPTRWHSTASTSTASRPTSPAARCAITPIRRCFPRSTAPGSRSSPSSPSTSARVPCAGCKTATISVRSLLAGAAAALLAGALVPLPAAAQDFPSRPLRIVVPWPPAGNVDITARAIAPALGDALGQQVIVDNRAGAAGRIGSAEGAKAAPDGYTLLLGSTGTITAGSAGFKKISYDARKG